MIFDLDDEQATDPRLAGGKGAGLARARRAGLPVLPGIVIAASCSREAMGEATTALASRGSGGARLVIMAGTLPMGLIDDVERAVSRLGSSLVVRSSSELEGDGAWAGAFTSYRGVAPSELATAIRGCWASAFSVSTLARAEAAGLRAGEASMAVVVQPAIEPSFGGMARLEASATVVIGVQGSPAALLDGLASGALVRVLGDGSIVGDDGLALLGESLIHRVAAWLRLTQERLGFNSCEWGSTPDGTVVLFQLGMAMSREAPIRCIPEALRDPRAARIAAMVRRSPGPLGEAFVLPWAIGEPASGVEHEVEPAVLSSVAALAEIPGIVRALVGQVWHRPNEEAMSRSFDLLRRLRSDDPGPALVQLGVLGTPDAVLARRLRSLLARVRVGLAEVGEVADPVTGWYTEPDRATQVLAGLVTAGPHRVGVDRWEPFLATVGLAAGRWMEGVAASPGIGSGRLCYVGDGSQTVDFRPRDVVVASHPVPSLGALLWDAAALVTVQGGPAAHLFEAARSIGIPAVAGIALGSAIHEPLDAAHGHYALVVDGDSGVVAITSW